MSLSKLSNKTLFSKILSSNRNGAVCDCELPWITAKNKKFTGKCDNCGLKRSFDNDICIDVCKNILNQLRKYKVEPTALTMVDIDAISAKVESPLASSLPAWFDRDEPIINYLHLYSLVTPNVDFEWYHMSYAQFMKLRKWARGECKLDDVIELEDYEYMLEKKKILYEIEEYEPILWKEIIRKLHMTARSKEVLFHMQRKKRIIQIRSVLSGERVFQADDNCLNTSDLESQVPSSSNDTSVLGSLARKIRTFYQKIISSTMNIIDIARKVKNMFKMIKNFFTNIPSKTRDLVRDYPTVIGRIAVFFMFMVAVLYFKSAVATMIVSLLAMILSMYLDDKMLAVLSALGGLAAFKTHQGQQVTSSMECNPTFNININASERIFQSKIPGVPALVAFCFAVLASTYCPFDTAWKTFYDKCDKLPKAANGLIKMTQFFQNVFEDHMGEYVEKATGYKITSTRPIPESVIQNSEEVKELARLSSYSDMPSDVGVCLRIERAYVEYLQLKTQFFDNALIREYLNAYQGSIVDLFKRASAANPRVCSERPKPVCAFFTGTTGVGKSSMMYLVTADILKRHGILEGKTDDEIMKLVNSSIYARNASQEFFDGYLNQLVTVVDDFGCMVDGPAHPNKDFEELLHMVNNFPYPLPMASLSQKANTYFTSKFVFLTSNLKQMNCTSMINPEALRSRISYRFNVSVKPEFMKNSKSDRVEDRGIDVQKVRAIYGDDMTTDIYVIEVLDPITSKVVENISYEQMIERIISKQTSEQQFFNNKQVSIIKHLNRYNQGIFNWINGKIFETQQKKILLMDAFESLFVEEPDPDSAYAYRRPYRLKNEIINTMMRTPEHSTDEEFHEILSSIRVHGPAHFTFLTQEYRLHGLLLSAIDNESLVSVKVILSEAATHCQYDYIGSVDISIEDLLERSSLLRFVDRASVSENPDYFYYPDVRPTLIHAISLYNLDRFQQKLSGILNSSVGYTIGIVSLVLAVVGVSSFVHDVVDEFNKEKDDDFEEEVEDDYYFQDPTDRKIRPCRLTAEELEQLLPFCDLWMEEIDGKNVKVLTWLKGATKSGKEVAILSEGFERSENIMDLESGKTKKQILIKQLESGKTKQAHIKKILESGRTKKMLNRKHEAFNSIQASEVSKIVAGHLRELRFDDQVLAMIVALKGHWFMMNSHYIKILRERYSADAVMTIVFPGHTEGSNIPFSYILSGHEVKRAGEDTDIWVFKAPKTVNMCSDLTKHFHTRSDMTLLAADTSCILVLPKIIHVCRLMNKSSKMTTAKNVDGSRRTLRCMIYDFDVKSSHGDCGGLYIADSNFVKNKIIGMHFAGISGGGGSAMPLVKEDFAFLDDEPSVTYPAYINQGVNGLAEQLDGIIPLGHAKPVHSAIDTSIIKTSIFNQVQESTVMPARLGRLLEENGAGMKAIQKVLPTVPYIEQEEIEMAKQSFCQVMYRNNKKTMQRVLTKEEAVHGRIAEDEPYVRGINRVTSSGYPYMLTNKNGKREMFGYDDYVFSDKGQDVLQNVERKINMIKTENIYEQCIYVDTLKDETRAIEKVVAGKTRLFSAAPVDYVILFRMYFLSFLNWIMVNRIRNEVSVGICAQSVDWHRLVMHLKHQGDNIVAGDFSNYDGTLNPSILRCVCDIINEWYSDGNERIRDFIFEDIIHSIHIAENNVYMWTHSQPSGNPGTAVINSIYNSLACRIAYNRITRGTKYYGGFNTYINMNSYGDDNLLSINEEIVELVNQQSLTEAFRSFGMTYTDEAKSVTERPYKPLVECSYLKRGFRYDQTINMWVGPLQQNSINERLNWHCKNPDPESILMQNAEGAIAEWALHEPAVFEYWSTRINKVFLDKGKYVPVFPQSYYLELLLNDSYSLNFPQLEFASKDETPIMKAVNIEREYQGKMTDDLVTKEQPTTQYNNFNTNPTNPSLVGNPQTEPVNTARFTSEGETPFHNSTLTTESDVQLNVASDPRFHQIRDFLMRPYRIPGITTLKGNDGSYGLLFQINIEDHLMQMLSRYKLKGFYGFKGTAKLRVLTNPQPFQTGLLQVAYLPKFEVFEAMQQEVVLPNPMGGFYFSGFDDFVTTRYESGCPNVLINLGSTSEAFLKVPYVGAYSLMPLKRNEMMFGEFHIRFLVPLADSTNNPECGISCYLSFEDIELFATTPLTLEVDEDHPDEAERVFQGKVPQNTEAKQKGGAGPVSKIAGIVGDAASALTAIPAVADIAGPVSWIAKGIGSVASMFGFSKPHSEEPSKPVWINPYKEFPLCDGVDQSTKLTVTPRQEIEVRPIGETTDDEMSLNYILAKPVYWAGYQWRSEYLPGKCLAAIPITPLMFRDTFPSYQGSSYPASSHTFVSYIASLFQFWMGTIRLTMTIVGNKFYSGRLRFVFVPNVTLSMRSDQKLQQTIFDSMQHTYSHIVDIRDADTFTIDCPYVSLTPWKRTHYVTESGVLFIFVEHQLAHADTVSSNLILNMHVSGLEDLTFAGPTRPRGTPAMGWDANRNHFAKRKNVTEREFQGFTKPLADQNAPVNISIVNDIKRADPELAHKTAIGDPVTSLRQLVKRFTPHDFIQWESNTLIMQPFKLNDSQDDPYVKRTDFVTSDFVDYVSFLYRFRKGGIRLAVRGIEDPNTVVLHRNIAQIKAEDAIGMYYKDSNQRRSWTRPSCAYQLNLPDAVYAAEVHNCPAYSVIPYSENIQGFLQIEVPYYHEYSVMENNRLRYLLDMVDDKKVSSLMKAPQDIPNVTTSNIIQISRPNKNLQHVEIYRAAADDFNCGFLLGPPPTVDFHHVGNDGSRAAGDAEPVDRETAMVYKSDMAPGYADPIKIRNIKAKSYADLSKIRNDEVSSDGATDGYICDRQITSTP